MLRRRNVCVRGAGVAATTVIWSMGRLEKPMAIPGAVRSITRNLSCSRTGQLSPQRYGYGEISRLRMEESTGLGNMCFQSRCVDLQRASFMTTARLNHAPVQRRYNHPDIGIASDPVLEETVDPTEALGDGPGTAGANAASENLPLSRNTGKATMSKMAIEMEMRWLNDRAALADRISQILKNGDFDKAATLVREAQRGGLDCMVAWNLLLDYEMQNGRPASAFRLYNEVQISALFMPSSRLYCRILFLDFRKCVRWRCWCLFSVTHTDHVRYR